MRQDVSRNDERIVSIASDTEQLLADLKATKAQLATLMNFEARVEEKVQSILNGMIARRSDYENDFESFVSRANDVHEDLETIWNYAGDHIPSLTERSQRLEDQLDITDRNLTHGLVEFRK